MSSPLALSQLATCGSSQRKSFIEVGVGQMYVTSIFDGIWTDLPTPGRGALLVCYAIRPGKMVSKT